MTCSESQQQAGMEGAGRKVLRSGGEREHCGMHQKRLLGSWTLPCLEGWYGLREAKIVSEVSIKNF